MPHKPSLPKDGANKCVWISMISVDAKTSSTAGEIWPISSAWAPVEAVTAVAGLGSVAFMAKSALDGLDCQHTKDVGRLFATRMSDGRGDSEAINHWRDCQLVKTKLKIQRYLMNRSAHQLLARLALPFDSANRAYQNTNPSNRWHSTIPSLCAAIAGMGRMTYARSGIARELLPWVASKPTMPGNQSSPLSTRGVTSIPATAICGSARKM